MSTPSPPADRLRHTIWTGDAAEVLPRMPSDAVDAIVTSPPYYRQRDYGHPAQLGNESSPTEYVDRLAGILACGLRVVKPTGGLWLVLGDKFESGGLLGMPWRVALAARDLGWILRSDIIWHKPNAVPSPVRNRPTIDHEYVFFFVRSADYFYNADAIREPHVTFTARSRMRGGRAHLKEGGKTPEAGKFGGRSNLHRGTWDQAFHPKGRNKRTVWSVPVSKSREQHFAVFPPQLVRTMIQAGTPFGGVVLDPFLGSGTTAVVAAELGRIAWGIDIQEDYCRMADQRLSSPHPINPAESQPAAESGR